MSDKYLALVIECVREIGSMDGNEALAECHAKTKLFGSSGNLDSMGLVTLLVEIEHRLGEQFGFNVVLADDKAMSRQVSPFRNVESLAAYVAEVVGERH